MPSILIVDDDEDLGEIVVEVLGSSGYAAKLARSGAEALGCLADELPSLVLLDWSLPDAHPEELAARFRNAGVPVVLTSGRERTRELGREIGAADVLDKPYDVEQLVAVVARLLEARDLNPPV